MTTANAQFIVDRASNELGLATSSLTAGLITQVGTQSLALLNSLGDDLCQEHDWQFLESVMTITGDGVANEFDLPDDYGRIVSQTGWAAADRMPVIGPMNAQQWGWTQYGIVSIGVFFRYRVLNNKLAIFPVPADGEELTFFYISKNWVSPLAGGTSDIITLGTDTPVFDRNLLVKGLKVRLWAQKGFDTTALSAEFNQELSFQKAQNQGAPVISLSSNFDTFYISTKNIPDGSW